MANSEETMIKIIPNFPHNFRAVCSIKDAKTNQSKGLLYRSSKPDYMRLKDVDDLKNVLDIKCIIDLRSKGEYTHSDGSKFVDERFKLIKVKVPHTLKRLQPDEKVETEVLEGSGLCIEKHYLINFFTTPYIWTVYNRAPWYVRLYSLIWLLLDLVLCTGYQYFVQCFSYSTLNKEGLIGTYKDIVELSHRSICSALKLMTDPDNIPAVINCAHGKDRTGIITALVLSCMGRSVHDICMDYALSENELEPIQDRLYDDIVKRYHWDCSFLHAKYETMLELLSYISDKYGSVQNYLEFIGFGQEDQRQLCLNLGGETLESDRHLNVSSGHL
ncbi:hypothetical protein CHS0354_007600 [Potamilus streckersoni]|uniref:Tyrosine specific protein phosphatases domain-containing protein n=1 Tax=Potamilus streckersoni TaxID=2493646 RepID=A0AAE0W6V6_9BIVA|nr:hypothetical protein CHS0354_007600 [Potamilus streckersoni]